MKINPCIHGQQIPDNGVWNTQWRKDNLLSFGGPNNLKFTHKRIKPDPQQTPLMKINSKWIKDLIRPETIKLLAENTGKMLFNMCLGNDLFYI